MIFTPKRTIFAFMLDIDSGPGIYRPFEVAREENFKEVPSARNSSTTFLKVSRAEDGSTVLSVLSHAKKFNNSRFSLIRTVAGITMDRLSVGMVIGDEGELNGFTGKSKVKDQEGLIEVHKKVTAKEVALGLAEAPLGDYVVFYEPLGMGGELRHVFYQKPKKGSGGLDHSGDITDEIREMGGLGIIGLPEEPDLVRSLEWYVQGITAEAGGEELAFNPDTFARNPLLGVRKMLVHQ